ncbi:MAG: aminotransferase class V-fold PLP-dependent enzyme [Candidatus Dormiibacterota bacterium]
MAGHYFLQIPGPTNIPSRVLDAMRLGTINPRGEAFPPLLFEVQERLARLFGTASGEVVVSAGSGIGAVESAFVNTLAPGETVLVLVNGFFATLAADVATKCGIAVERLAVDPGEALPMEALAARLRQDDGTIKAVFVVHNETSTGVTNDLPAIRRTIDAAGHNALLLVDAVSSLASIEVRFDDWGLDVVAVGCQKGLMLPPGLAIVCASPKAVAASQEGGSPRNFFDWRPVIAARDTGLLPLTPPTPYFFALREALRMLEEEGLDAVYARHQRLAEGVRQAVSAWDLTPIGRPGVTLSNSLTAVRLPDGVGARAVRDAGVRRGLEVGGGIAPLHETSIRIAHMGALGELEVLATIGGVELALLECGAPIAPGAGLRAAEAWFATAVPDGVTTGVAP